MYIYMYVYIYIYTYIYICSFFFTIYTCSYFFNVTLNIKQHTLYIIYLHYALYITSGILLMIQYTYYIYICFILYVFSRLIIYTPIL